MEQIKIGDIVEPVTSYQRRKFGIGIVLKVQDKDFPITVIFLSRKHLFEVREYQYWSLDTKMVDQIKRKQLIDIAYTYRQMQQDLLRA